MAIPSRQIGWSGRANLLWQISKQLEYLTCVVAGGCGTTTTTTTEAPITTTTTTTAALVNSTNAFVDCTAPCDVPCVFPFNYFDVWMTQECLDNWPQIGCAIWLNIEGTVAFPDGSYNNGNAACIVITDGIITNII